MALFPPNSQGTGLRARSGGASAVPAQQAAVAGHVTNSQPHAPHDSPGNATANADQTGSASVNPRLVDEVQASSSATYQGSSDQQVPVREVEHDGVVVYKVRKHVVAEEE